MKSREGRFGSLGIRQRVTAAARQTSERAAASSVGTRSNNRKRVQFSAEKRERGPTTARCY
eukprot:2091856-Pleurochrysis_carterae.AAC.2